MTDDQIKTVLIVKYGTLEKAFEIWKYAEILHITAGAGYSLEQLLDYIRNPYGGDVEIGELEIETVIKEDFQDYETDFIMRELDLD